MNYSPKAAVFLEELHQACDAQAAFYCAFVIVCLHAERDVTGHDWVDEVKSSDLQSYTFFTYAKDKPHCLALFDAVLTTYQADQRPPTDGKS